MSITVTASGPAISATVSGGAVSASVAAPTSVAATVAGGIGPTVATGVTTLAGASDVQISSATDGDVLRYSGTASKWTNVNETSLLDAGNF